MESTLPVALARRFITKPLLFTATRLERLVALFEISSKKYNLRYPAKTSGSLDI